MGPRKQYMWQDLVPQSPSENGASNGGKSNNTNLKSLTMTLRSSLHLTKQPEAEPAAPLSDAEIIAQMKLAAGPILEAQLKKAIEEGADQEEIDRLTEQLAAMTASA